jgi:amino acid adenylation domain-containing protein
MTDISERIASLSPEKRALFENRLAESSATKIHSTPLLRAGNGPPVPSFGQERLWAIEQMERGTALYIICFAVSMKGELDTAALKSALIAVVSRHETLRTRYRMSADGLLELEISAPGEFPLSVEDLSAVEQSQRESRLSAALRAEANRPFALDREPVFRAALYKLAECEHVLQLTMHHVAADAWSKGVLLRDLAAFYNAAATGAEPQLPELPIAFSDYARWQREQMAGPEGERLIAYWKDKIDGSSFVLPLPTDRPRPANQTFLGASRLYSMPVTLASEIKRFCLREKVTPYMVTLAALYAVLARYTGQNDLLVGSPIASRTRIETEDLVGFFTNTVILRGNVDGDPDFRELLHRVRETALEAFAHQELPLELLIGKIHPERDPSRSPVFQVMLVFQNAPTSAAGFHRLETSIQRVRPETSMFDMTIELLPSGEALDGVIQFNTDLFDAVTIDRLWGHFASYLQQAIAAPEKKVAAISPLAAAERRQLLVEWNTTERAYPRATPLAELVEAQVERTPNAVAVVYGEQHLTYRELNQRANQLAHELRKHDAAPDRLVGICLERSIGLVVALLAVVKAGAAYLPLDPLLPPERFSYVLADSGVGVVVTGQNLRGKFQDFAGTTILMEDAALNANPRDNLAVRVGPEDLAYLIYTSGSTGKPKGVQIPRRALTNFLWSMREWLQISEQDRLLAVTTISFDIAGMEIWLPLLVGAQIVVADRESTVDGSALRTLLERHGITFLQATPVTWQLLFDAGWKGKPDLQAVCGGEAMPQELAVRLAPAVKRLWNLYGPTETTIWSTGYLVKDGREPVLIGRPVANTKCYIVDGQLEPVPVGVPGNLNIGGDGLARGYLNSPELTAEKFVADPFCGNGARMYLTGDLARYRADGNIECLGRLDHQVKIRGYRIELGEIEAALKELPGIEQALVIAREDSPGEKRLAAYLVARAGQTPEPAQLQSRLQQCLPEFMVPAAYVFLDRLPVSPNGKIDRKALPPPGSVLPPAHSGPGEFVPAGNRTEEKIAAIFARVLGVSEVGATGDFFNLGGHSMNATRAVALLNTEFGTAFPVRVLFQAHTVRQLAAIVDKHEASQVATWPTLIPIQVSGTRAPLFCIARPNVNALGYLFLSRELGDDQPVYGLQVQLEEDPQLEFTDQQYRNTASEYICAIKTVQPHGPYQMIGQCHGAYIAFEAVRQLEEAGEQVAFLGILDTWTEENTRHKWLFFIDLAVERLRKSVGRASGLGKRTAPPRPQPSNISDDQKKAIQESPDFGTNLVRRYWPGKRFRPTVCSSVITVFRVRKQAWYRKNDVSLGWRDRSCAGVNVERISGNHLNFLRPPHVQKLAALITKIFDVARHLAR